MKLPLARNKDLAIQELRDEVLIYDLKIDKAYCLNETAMRIFQACNGTTTFADINKKYKFSDDLILLSLAELRSVDLIQENPENYFSKLSRRELARRAGLASLAALPIISVLIAPTASHAASQSCTGSNANGTQVNANGGGIGSNNAAAQTACFNNLNCSCQSGNAVNKTITLCAGASSAQTCVCNGTCAAACVNSNGGASSGTNIDGSGGGIGSNNSQAQAACLSNLNSSCCSGRAVNTSITLCAGASSAQTCVCNGTCA